MFMPRRAGSGGTAEIARREPAGRTTNFSQVPLPGNRSRSMLPARRGPRSRLPREGEAGRALSGPRYPDPPSGGAFRCRLPGSGASGGPGFRRALLLLGVLRGAVLLVLLVLALLFLFPQLQELGELLGRAAALP